MAFWSPLAVYTFALHCTSSPLAFFLALRPVTLSPIVNGLLNRASPSRGPPGAPRISTTQSLRVHGLGPVSLHQCCLPLQAAPWAHRPPLSLGSSPTRGPADDLCPFHPIRPPRTPTSLLSRTLAYAASIRYGAVSDHPPRHAYSPLHGYIEAVSPASTYAYWSSTVSTRHLSGPIGTKRGREPPGGGPSRFPDQQSSDRPLDGHTIVSV